jgi:ATP-binding cassette subfamily F protein uup
VAEPDILLLDEPTNHLDVDAVEWMEQFLIDRGTTLLFVTHDRAFLRRLATRILEIDRGKLTSWPGDYDTFQRWKVFADDSTELEFPEKELRFDDAIDVTADAEIGGYVETPLESMVS